MPNADAILCEGGVMIAPEAKVMPLDVHVCVATGWGYLSIGICPFRCISVSKMVKSLYSVICIMKGGMQLLKEIDKMQLFCDLCDAMKLKDVGKT